MKKEPPDKYQTLKISFKKIVKNEDVKMKLTEVVVRTNKLVIHVYQMLRLWILNKYHEKNDIPTITENTIKMLFKSLTLPSKGGKNPSGENLKIYNEFVDFYEKEYKKLGYENKLSGLHLSQIISYLSVDIITNIENNVRLHFIDYFNRFINMTFKDKINKKLEKYKAKEKIEKKKELHKELNTLKKDLLENTLNSKKKYHKWINENKNKILPIEINKSIHYDIVCNPQKYVKYMIYLNSELEKNEKKQFQFCPLRTNIFPKYCPIDTKSLIEILIDTDKNKYLKNINELKESIWDTYFNLNNKIFKQNKYTFDYRILTDGYTVSIQFINNKYIEKEKQKKENMKLARSNLKENNNVETKEKTGKIKEISKNNIEFPYLDELSKNKIEEIKNNNKVYNDPGKRVILNMMDDNGVKLSYTNKQRIHETKRFKYQRLLKNHKDKNKISKIEENLAKFNSKSCDINNYKDYIKEKNKLNNKLQKLYENEIFRKYKWYGYLNTRRSEAKLQEKIKEKFGKNCNILYGNWGVTKQMRNFISTPMIGIKRKIKEKFPVYNLDEFRTSCLNYKTEELCQNIYLPDKKGKLRKIHAILTYQMENKRYGCINRDWNSVKNMKKIVDYWFENKERPIKFRREYDLVTKSLKVSNQK